MIRPGDRKVAVTVTTISKFGIGKFGKRANLTGGD